MYQSEKAGMSCVCIRWERMEKKVSTCEQNETKWFECRLRIDRKILASKRDQDGRISGRIVLKKKEEAGDTVYELTMMMGDDDDGQ